MKHYVLIEEQPYEGQALRGIFDSAQQAREHVDASDEADHWMYDRAELWVYEGGARVADLGCYPFAETVVLP